MYRFRCLLKLIIPALILGSCSDRPVAAKDLDGCWWYRTSEGNYAEVCFGSGKLANIRATEEYVHVFQYRLQDDSLYILDFDRQMVDALLIVDVQASKLRIMQDSLENELFRISDRQILIDTSLDFRRQMEIDFRKRLKSN